MMQYESFSDCLKRCLKDTGITASEASRLVGFRSRNSMFRILAGEASNDVKLRFLESFHQAIGQRLSDERWLELQVSLTVERLGVERYQANRAFQQVMHFPSGKADDFVFVKWKSDGSMEEHSFAEELKTIAASPKVEIVMTGCCDRAVMQLLAECFNDAGAQGRVFIRHYIDTAENTVAHNILSVLPLVSKPWYNARMVIPSTCPAEMMTIFRLHAMHIHQWDEEGRLRGSMFLRYDETHFSDHLRTEGPCPAVPVMDHWRFHLDLLKPLPQLGEGMDAFVGYTSQYAQLEENCTILSIKPDPHFNCIPAELLEQAVIEGFEQSGMAAAPELLAYVEKLKEIHERRFRNMMEKHKPTHLVYNLAMMERFMRTGVLTDHFFLQRAYTVEERRQIIRVLLDAMREHPYFNVHFLKPGIPELCYEISYYDGKGVLLMDAYTGYELGTEHSEALITLPAFMESFKAYFKDELQSHYVLSRKDTIRELERLLVMKVKE